VPRPTTAQPIRTWRTTGSVRRQAAGNWRTSIRAKKTRPSTATGTPATLEYELVVTARQLTIPLSEQASVDDPV
jgi:hypothetical protein